MKRFLVILVFIPFMVSAHGEGGTVEKTVGDYFVDVGYSDGILRADKSSRFDFLLLKNVDRTDTDFNEVFVKITKNNTIYFVMTLPRPAFGSAGMTLTFPEAGDYKVDLSYLKDKSTVVATDFLLTVQPSETEATGAMKFLRLPIVSFTVGILAGIVIQYVISKMK